MSKDTSQNVVVVGGSSGIGAALVALLRGEGDRVLVVDREAPNPEDADFLTADVRDSAGLNQAAKTALERLDRIDGLVYCVGVLDGYGQLAETTDELLTTVLDINLIGAVRAIRAFTPAMIERGQGRIVLVSSIAGNVAGAGGLAYTASKHALNGVMRHCALELGPTGVTVNAVAPGSIAGTRIREGITDQISGGLDVRRGISSITGRPAEESHPVGRLGTPEVVAHAIAQLLLPEVWFTTGAILMVDGGYTAR